MKENNINAKNILLHMELLSAKLLHDLAGPIGAVVNYIEFLSEGDSDKSKDFICLLMEASNEIMARFRLSRQSYSFSEDNKNFSSTKANVEEYLDTKKVKLSWNIAVQIYNVQLVEKINKLVSNIIILSTMIMIDGKEVEVLLQEDGDKVVLKITLKAQGIEICESIQDIFDEKTNYVLDAKNIQAWIISMLLMKYNVNLSYNLIQKGVLEFCIPFVNCIL
ncbi:hypothetical protein HL033_03180 [Neoehrlichia mikurensis]|uniref:Histidine phosphotransferase ChpT C-terminal domain-containing protein n=1 Tax=Neoehrlichia mikurensis TaxID=89586 RepID=A0A9Q9F466_9RICK|nr:histidine phosphotransferase family protein [Neoehrlichia mikurensis]QXK91748.1 hypothetical protein IAH97_03175 [Neoehrlichia mikurensis]QXK92960.1 hypothetical protein HUN61_03170 [Neoehrlichia mikurensis]QXK93438.1 hypothetical protein HL033_03180 [Neoehrlichia mikurensis]UTO55608.1 hypothetical protein LUA82_00765 [Neoehrlichia mikurensis]UTO56529.1 hypothetical protein LUA81_00765 [Neoehrlichia mikurensis]